ncbi:2-amino-4-oxopentanoate thiolase subunit OrtA [Methylomarinum vadi]|uniref:2-amino-4-oxopentanoate thiolase subunit OrtA n=1 Tax=Methylomarinum vadi TaxID=438855 RepID=UPI0004DF40E9|nr:2-amino-4-oxopentanoate thiolase subunit OrtA [Methylomarinum vadi]
MSERIEAGVWVEIHDIVLEAGERAPQVPEDTARIPLEMRVKGFLSEPAELGGEAEIVTAAGRRLRGKLVDVNPAYRHGFGPPIPELSTIGRELRTLLGQREISDD